MSIETRILLTLLKHRRLLVEELLSLTGASADVVESILVKYEKHLKVLGREVVLVKPVELALELISKGVGPARISKTLNWRDFEELSTRILLEFGYEAIHGLTLTSPVKLEIDVFGVEPISRLGIAIDCKHWSTNTEAKLIEAANKHLERMSKLIRYFPRLKAKYRELSKTRQILPALITLFTPPIRVHNNVLIFSIEEMPQILRDIRIVIDTFDIKLIRPPTW